MQAVSVLKSILLNRDVLYFPKMVGPINLMQAVNVLNLILLNRDVLYRRGTLQWLFHHHYSTSKNSPATWKVIYRKLCWRIMANPPTIRITSHVSFMSFSWLPHTLNYMMMQRILHHSSSNILSHDWLPTRNPRLFTSGDKAGTAAAEAPSNKALPAQDEALPSRNLSDNGHHSQQCLEQ